MTLNQFVSRLSMRANEAVPGRFITPAEFILMINDAELWAVKRSEYYKSTSAYSTGNYISALGTTAYNFDLPGDYLGLDPDGTVKTGLTKQVNVTAQTLRNWYAQQTEVLSSGVYVATSNIAAGGGRFVIQTGIKSRLAAGKSGAIIQFDPNLVAKDQFIVSYIAVPAEHTALTSNMHAPRIYHQAMQDFCLAIIKEKAGDMADSAFYLQKAESEIRENFEKTSPAAHWQQKMVSPRRARGTYQPRR